MNFDGKAIVVDQYVETFYSDNGSAIVIPSVKSEFNSFLGEANVERKDYILSHDYSSLDKSIVFNQDAYEKTFEKTFSPYSVNIQSKVPYTVVIAEEINGIKEKEPEVLLAPFEKVLVLDKTSTLSTDKDYDASDRILMFDKKSRYTNVFLFSKVKIIDIMIPTNLLINNKAVAYIIDATKAEEMVEFPSISANIVDKTEIVVPPPTKGYQDMFLVVQKNNFIELKLSDTILDVTGLPEGLEYSLNAIKGIITKSGSYDIRIQYQESAQKLNIIVPYYERTL